MITNDRSFTNLTVGVTREAYDTNSAEVTTNWFECSDVYLTNGPNLITFHAADLAGNITLTNYTFVYDPSTHTNAPLINLYWPQNGTVIAGTNYAWRGWVDDPTATVSAQLVDTNGNTNIFDGFVERNGNFWIENLPLPPGTNYLTLTVTDSATNVTTTNIAITPASFALTVNDVDTAQVWNKYAIVSGTVGSSGYSVWVNGAKATITGTNWAVTNVPMTPNGTVLVQARAIPNSDHSGNGTGGSGGTAADYSNPGNPSSSGGIDVESQADKPTIVRQVGDYFHRLVQTSNHQDNALINWVPDVPYTYYHNISWSNSPGDIGSSDTVFTGPTEPECLFGDLSQVVSWITVSNENGVITTNAGSDSDGDFWQPDAVSGGGSQLQPDGSLYCVTNQPVFELLVGGKGFPGPSVLVQLNCTATQYLNLITLPEKTLPYSAIQLMNQTMGNDDILNVVLPAGTQRACTPRIPGINYYATSLGVTPDNIKISVNGNPLFQEIVAVTNFCVGQRLKFWLTNFPVGVTSTNYRWDFTGIYKNDFAQACPTCSSDPIVNLSFLTNAVVTNWWVTGKLNNHKDDGAIVFCDLFFANGNSPTPFQMSGLFYMDRPEASVQTVTKAVYIDASWPVPPSVPPGSPSLTFGDNYGPGGSATGPGIKFMPSVAVPSNYRGNTNLQWVQVLTNLFERELLNDGWYRAQGTYLLDKLNPYPFDLDNFSRTHLINV